MDFNRNPDIDNFRQEVREFLHQHLPAEMARRGSMGFLPDRADMLEWTRILHRARGWSVPGWPVAYGGTGWSIEQRYVFEEECYLAGAPIQNQAGVHLVGPVIYKYGNEEQKRRFLPGIAQGETFWIQGFSEPGAGSDLASLRTTAIRDGDHFVVNGQKIWTSFGLYGDWNFVLVRTDPEVKPQKGISFLLLDAKSPGVTIRPLTSLEGAHHLAEVFYDNVRVPVENLVGEENKGWTYAKALLFDERAFLGADAPELKRLLAKIRCCASAQKSAARPRIENPAIARKFAELELEVLAIDMAVQRVLHQRGDAGGESMSIGSILKVRGSELHQQLYEMLVELIGDYGAVYFPDSNEMAEYRDRATAGPAFAPGLMGGLVYARARTIFGGTAEIQRGIIAKSMFGL